MNVPNTITIVRVFLALLAVSLCWSTNDAILWTSFILTAVIIWGDGLDGYFARKLGQTTKLGAILDIAGDRVVEMAYFIVFAVLGWIPAWIPLLFLVRGTFVDAIRAQASEQGMTAFGEKTMMQTGLGKLLVSSNFSRGSYAVVKAVAFCLIIAGRTKLCHDTVIPTIAIYCAYASAVFCVLRGLPVLVEGRRLFEAKAS
jgi:CDP-diacylglycerol--glycerol-3-phosphate 3-phosphatidyltransferase